MKNGKFKRIVSLITLASFLFSIVGNDLMLAKAYAEPSANIAPKKLNITDLEIPYRLGEIKGIQSPSARSTIIHIQDAHCNYSAQQSISGIIEHLSKSYGARLVMLEGGKGDYDMSIFTKIKDPGIREKVSGYFMKEGRVNGAEYFAANNPGKIKLFGVEDEELYFENLAAYRDSLTSKEEADEILSALTNTINNFKNKVYSPVMKELDNNAKNYLNKKIELRDHIKYLSDKTAANKTDLATYPNLHDLADLCQSEKDIDFNRANKERSYLIDKLTTSVPKAELETLIGKSMDFAAGNIPSEEFYGYIFNKSRLANIGLEDYPNLVKYSSYIKVYESIDKVKLFNELESLKDALFLKLAKTDDQATLYNLDKTLAILKSMANFSLVKEDFDYYLANKDSFSVTHYLDFFSKKAIIYKVRLPTVIASPTEDNPSVIARPEGPKQSLLDSYRENIEKFYNYSLKRDAAFIKNIESKLKKERAKVAILVSGGFHTQNLKKLFTEKGYTYIEVMPRIKPDGAPNPYFRLLGGDVTPLEKFLIKAITSLPQSSMISLWSAFSHSANSNNGADTFRLGAAVLEGVLSNDGATIITNGGSFKVQPRSPQGVIALATFNSGSAIGELYALPCAHTGSDVIRFTTPVAASPRVEKFAPVADDRIRASSTGNTGYEDLKRGLKPFIEFDGERPVKVKEPERLSANLQHIIGALEPHLITKDPLTATAIAQTLDLIIDSGTPAVFTREGIKVHFDPVIAFDEGTFTPTALREGINTVSVVDVIGLIWTLKSDDEAVSAMAKACLSLLMRENKKLGDTLQAKIDGIKGMFKRTAIFSGIMLAIAAAISFLYTPAMPYACLTVGAILAGRLIAFVAILAGEHIAAHRLLNTNPFLTFLSDHAFLNTKADYRPQILFKGVVEGEAGWEEEKSAPAFIMSRDELVIGSTYSGGILRTDVFNRRTGKITKKFLGTKDHPDYSYKPGKPFYEEAVSDFTKAMRSARKGSRSPEMHKALDLAVRIFRAEAESFIPKGHRASSTGIGDESDALSEPAFGTSGIEKQKIDSLIESIEADLPDRSKRLIAGRVLGIAHQYSSPKADPGQDFTDTSLPVLQNFLLTIPWKRIVSPIVLRLPLEGAYITVPWRSPDSSFALRLPLSKAYIDQKVASYVNDPAFAIACREYIRMNEGNIIGMDGLIGTIANIAHGFQSARANAMQAERTAPRDARKKIIDLARSIDQDVPIAARQAIAKRVLELGSQYCQNYTDTESDIADTAFFVLESFVTGIPWRKIGYGAFSALPFLAPNADRLVERNINRYVASASFGLSFRQYIANNGYMLKTAARSKIGLDVLVRGFKGSRVDNKGGFNTPTFGTGSRFSSTGSAQYRELKTGLEPFIRFDGDRPVRIKNPSELSIDLIDIAELLEPCFTSRDPQTMTLTAQTIDLILRSEKHYRIATLQLISGAQHFIRFDGEEPRGLVGQVEDVSADEIIRLLWDLRSPTRGVKTMAKNCLVLLMAENKKAADARQARAGSVKEKLRETLTFSGIMAAIGVGASLVVPFGMPYVCATVGAILLGKWLAYWGISVAERMAIRHLPEPNAFLTFLSEHAFLNEAGEYKPEMMYANDASAEDDGRTPLFVFSRDRFAIGQRVLVNDGNNIEVRIVRQFDRRSGEMTFGLPFVNVAAPNLYYRPDNPTYPEGIRRFTTRLNYALKYCENPEMRQALELSIKTFPVEARSFMPEASRASASGAAASEGDEVDAQKVIDNLKDMLSGYIKCDDKGRPIGYMWMRLPGDEVLDILTACLDNPHEEVRYFAALYALLSWEAIFFDPKKTDRWEKIVFVDRAERESLYAADDAFAEGDYRKTHNECAYVLQSWKSDSVRRKGLRLDQKSKRSRMLWKAFGIVKKHAEAQEKESKAAYLSGVSSATGIEEGSGPVEEGQKTGVRSPLDGVEGIEDYFNFDQRTGLPTGIRSESGKIPVELIARLALTFKYGSKNTKELAAKYWTALLSSAALQRDLRGHASGEYRLLVYSKKVLFSYFEYDRKKDIWTPKDGIDVSSIPAAYLGRLAIDASLDRIIEDRAQRCIECVLAQLVHKVPKHHFWQKLYNAGPYVLGGATLLSSITLFFGLSDSPYLAIAGGSSTLAAVLAICLSIVYARERDYIVSIPAPIRELISDYVEGDMRVERPFVLKGGRFLDDLMLEGKPKKSVRIRRAMDQESPEALYKGERRMLRALRSLPDYNTVYAYSFSASLNKVNFNRLAGDYEGLFMYNPRREGAPSIDGLCVTDLDLRCGGFVSVPLLIAAAAGGARRLINYVSSNRAEVYDIPSTNKTTVSAIMYIHEIARAVTERVSEVYYSGGNIPDIYHEAVYRTFGRASAEVWGKIDSVEAMIAKIKADDATFMVYYIQEPEGTQVTAQRIMSDLGVKVWEVTGAFKEAKPVDLGYAKPFEWEILGKILARVSGSESEIETITEEVAQSLQGILPVTPEASTTPETAAPEVIVGDGDSTLENRASASGIAKEFVKIEQAAARLLAEGEYEKAVEAIEESFSAAYGKELTVEELCGDASLTARLEFYAFQRGLHASLDDYNRFADSPAFQDFKTVLMEESKRVAQGLRERKIWVSPSILWMAMSDALAGVPRMPVIHKQGETYRVLTRRLSHNIGEIFKSVKYVGWQDTRIVGDTYVFTAAYNLVEKGKLEEFFRSPAYHREMSEEHRAYFENVCRILTGRPVVIPTAVGEDRDTGAEIRIPSDRGEFWEETRREMEDPDRVYEQFERDSSSGIHEEVLSPAFWDEATSSTRDLKARPMNVNENPLARIVTEHNPDTGVVSKINLAPLHLAEMFADPIKGPELMKGVEEMARGVKDRLLSAYPGESPEVNYIIWAGMGGSIEDKYAGKVTGALGHNAEFFGLDDVNGDTLAAIFNKITMSEQKRLGVEPGKISPEELLKSGLKRTVVIVQALGMTSREPVFNTQNAFLPKFEELGLKPVHHFSTITIDGSLVDQLLPASEGFTRLPHQPDGMATSSGRDDFMTNGMLLAIILSHKTIEEGMKTAWAWVREAKLSEEDKAKAAEIARFIVSNALEGRDKIVLSLPLEWYFGGNASLWIKQEFEESLGKSRKNGLKIILDNEYENMFELSDYRPADSPDNDKIFLAIRLKGLTNIPDEKIQELKDAGYEVMTLDFGDGMSAYPYRTILARIMQLVNYVRLDVARAWDICAVDQPPVENYKRIVAWLDNPGKMEETEERFFAGTAGKVERDGLTFNYRAMIERGLFTQAELDAKIKSLYLDEKDPADMAAAIYALGLERGAFEYGVINYCGDLSKSDMGKAMRETLLKHGAGRLWRKTLKSFADIGKVPGYGHSTHAMDIAWGRALTTSIIAREYGIDAVKLDTSYQRKHMIGNMLALAGYDIKDGKLVEKDKADSNWVLTIEIGKNEQDTREKLKEHFEKIAKILEEHQIIPVRVPRASSTGSDLTFTKVEVVINLHSSLVASSSAKELIEERRLFARRLAGLMTNELDEQERLRIAEFIVDTAARNGPIYFTDLENFVKANYGGYKEPSWVKDLIPTRFSLLPSRANWFAPVLFYAWEALLGYAIGNSEGPLSEFKRHLMLGFGGTASFFGWTVAANSMGNVHRKAYDRRIEEAKNIAPAFTRRVEKFCSSHRVGNVRPYYVIEDTTGDFRRTITVQGHEGEISIELKDGVSYNILEDSGRIRRTLVSGRIAHPHMFDFPYHEVDVVRTLLPDDEEYGIASGTIMTLLDTAVKAAEETDSYDEIRAIRQRCEDALRASSTGAEGEPFVNIGLVDDVIRTAKDIRDGKYRTVNDQIDRICLGSSGKLKGDDLKIAAVRIDEDGFKFSLGSPESNDFYLAEGIDRPSEFIDAVKTDGRQMPSITITGAALDYESPRAVLEYVRSIIRTAEELKTHKTTAERVVRATHLLLSGLCVNTRIPGESVDGIFIKEKGETSEEPDSAFMYWARAKDRSRSKPVTAFFETKQKISYLLQKGEGGENQEFADYLYELFQGKNAADTDMEPHRIERYQDMFRMAALLASTTEEGVGFLNSPLFSSVRYAPVKRFIELNKYRYRKEPKAPLFYYDTLFELVQPKGPITVDKEIEWIEENAGPEHDLAESGIDLSSDTAKTAIENLLRLKEILYEPRETRGREIKRFSSTGAKMRAVSILQKVENTLSDMHGRSHERTVAITDIVFRAYMAEETGEMTPEKLDGFKKGMARILSMAGPLADIDNAATILRKSALHLDVRPESVINGLNKMIKMAREKGEGEDITFDDIRLKSAKPSLPALLSRYGWLAGIAFDGADRFKHSQAVKLAEMVFGAYCEGTNDPEITRKRAEDLGEELKAVMETSATRKEENASETAVSILKSIHLDNGAADTPADIVVTYLLLTLQGKGTDVEALKGIRPSSTGTPLGKTNNVTPIDMSVGGRVEFYDLLNERVEAAIWMTNEGGVYYYNLDINNSPIRSPVSQEASWSSATSDKWFLRIVNEKGTLTVKIEPRPRINLPEECIQIVRKPASSQTEEGQSVTAPEVPEVTRGSTTGGGEKSTSDAVSTSSFSQWMWGGLAAAYAIILPPTIKLWHYNLIAKPRKTAFTYHLLSLVRESGNTEAALPSMVSAAIFDRISSIAGKLRRTRPSWGKLVSAVYNESTTREEVAALYRKRITRFHDRRAEELPLVYTKPVPAALLDTFGTVAEQSSAIAEAKKTLSGETAEGEAAVEGNVGNPDGRGSSTGGVPAEMDAMVNALGSGTPIEEITKPYLAAVPGITREQIEDALKEIVYVYQRSRQALTHPASWAMLNKAFALSIILHAGQPRARDDSRPYIIHAAGVVRLILEKFRLSDEIPDEPERSNIIAAAWLHDTIEDSKKGRWGQARIVELDNDITALRQETGAVIEEAANGDVRKIVEGLSKPDYEGEDLREEVRIEAEYYIDLARQPIGTQFIKAGDFAFNLGDIKNHPDRKFPLKFFTKRLAPVLGFLKVARLSERIKTELIRSIEASIAENNAINAALNDTVNAPPATTGEQMALLEAAKAGIRDAHARGSTTGAELVRFDEKAGELAFAKGPAIETFDAYYTEPRGGAMMDVGSGEILPHIWPAVVTEKPSAIIVIGANPTGDDGSEITDIVLKSFVTGENSAANRCIEHKFGPNNNLTISHLLASVKDVDQMTSAILKVCNQIRQGTPKHRISLAISRSILEAINTDSDILKLPGDANSVKGYLVENTMLTIVEDKLDKPGESRILAMPYGPMTLNGLTKLNLASLIVEKELIQGADYEAAVRAYAAATALVTNNTANIDQLYDKLVEAAGNNPLMYFVTSPVSIALPECAAVDWKGEQAKLSAQAKVLEAL